VSVRAQYIIGAKDKTKQATRSVLRNFKSMDKAAAALGVGIGAALGAAGAGAAMLAFTERVAKSLDALDKMSKRMGESAATVDSWTHVVTLGGASAETLEKATKAANKALGDASIGIGTARDYFKLLNISIRDNEGLLKSVPQLMIEFADKQKLLGSEAERSAAAQAIFGRAGTQLLPVFRQGSEAIKKQLIEARALGVRYGELAEAGAEVVDSQARFDRAMRSVGDTLTVAVMPALARVGNYMADKLLDVITKTTKEWRLFVAGLAVSGDLAGTESELAEIKDEIAKTGADLEAAEKSADKLGGSLKETYRKAETGILGYLETQESMGLAGPWKEANDEIERLKQKLEDLKRKEEDLARVRQELLDGQAAREKQELRAREERAEELYKRELEARRRSLAEQRKVIGDFWAANAETELEFLEDSTAEHLDALVKRYDAEYGLFVAFEEKKKEYRLDTEGKIFKNSLELYALGAETFADLYIDAFSRLIAYGDKTADLFEKAWRSAIASVAAELLKMLAIKGIIALANLFSPAAGAFVAGLFNETTPTGGEVSAASAAAPAGGQLFGLAPAPAAAPAVIDNRRSITIQTITPAAAIDLLQLDLASQDAALTGAQFQLA